MLNEAVLSTPLIRDSQSAEWYPSAETLRRTLQASQLNINCDNARCVLEAVIYSEPNT